MNEPGLLTALGTLAVVLVSLAAIWVRLRELKPNGGKSVADRVASIDRRLARVEGKLGVRTGEEEH